MSDFTRVWALDDIRVRSGGDGRTVEAYMAVFNRPAEVYDVDGHYREQVHPGAFTKTLADNGTRFSVFYNHARTLDGTPSDRYSMPIGVPEEITPDTRGIRVVDRYNRTPVADEVLENIRSGAIRGYSFSGGFMRSDPRLRSRGAKYRPAPDGSLTTVTRLEVAMREYGPTALPQYEEAAVLGLRGQLLDTRMLQALLAAPDDARLALAAQLTRNDAGPGSIGTPDDEDGAAATTARAAGVHSARDALRMRLRAALVIRSGDASTRTSTSQAGRAAPPR